MLGMWLWWVLPIAAQRVLPDSISMLDILPAPMVLHDNAAAISSTDTLPAPQPKKNAIDARVAYMSQDSLIITGKGIAHMYGSGQVNYKALELTADYIRVCMDSSTVFAKGVLDTIENEWVGLPVFKDANDSYESKELTYNLKTQKGKIRHVVTEQGEGFLIADETKKMDDNTLMLHGGKYTTCDDHDHPHFYLQMTKGTANGSGTSPTTK